jgi:mRNA interferase MazF
MPINQGDIYWVSHSDISDMPHPYIIVQEDDLNHSRTQTVVVGALTSNIQRVSMPGNVLLEAGEANLPKPSVVEVSKVLTLDKAQLGDYIGTLSEQRIGQILAGMRFVARSFR